MPAILVIDRDDAFLPRGWVSAILPEGKAPSGYEKSGKLWKVVPLPDGPELAKVAEPTPASYEDGTSLPEARCLLYENGALRQVEDPRKLIMERLESMGSTLRPVPGPDTLDRSHSVIWDYGPGRTYSSPQAAFDALVSQVGSNPFSETHYIRGWSGTYGQGASGYVLYVTTVSPTHQYPLVLDAESGEDVVFDDEGGSDCLAGYGVSHVRLREMNFKGATYFGVRPTENSYSINVLDWQIESCVFEGSEDSLGMGISLIKADDLGIRRCDFIDISSWAVGGHSSQSGYRTTVDVSGCLIKGGDYGLFNNSLVHLNLVNNTILATTNGIFHATSYEFYLPALLNNIFEGLGDSFICVRVFFDDDAKTHVLRSDGNCFHPGTNGKAFKLGNTLLDLAAWQSRLGQDQLSLETDPMLDENYVPLQGSPCLAAGVCWDLTGRGGARRTTSIDMGFEQLTGTAVPGVSVRRAPEIWRRR